VGTQFFERVLRNGLHGRLGSDWHKDWGLDLRVRSEKASGAGFAASCSDVERDGHFLGL
jgi:hypothetical protein